METIIENRFGHFGESDAKRVMKREQFTKRVRAREFGNLDRMGDAKLAVVVEDAREALRNFPIAIPHHNEDLLNEYLSVFGVYSDAKSIMEQRSEALNKTRRVQRARKDAVYKFAATVHDLREKLIQTDFALDLVAPDVPRLTESAARATDYRGLSSMVDAERFYMKQKGWEHEKVEDAISDIKALIDSKALDIVLADLESFRSRLVRIIEAHAENEKTARSEMERRRAEAVKRTDEEKSLIDTVRQLKETISEMEQQSAAISNASKGRMVSK